MNSLERRLQIALASSLILLMGIIGWLLITLSVQLTEEFAITRLQHDGETIIAALQFDSNGKPGINDERISAIYRQPLSGHYYQLYIGETIALTSRSLWDTQLEGISLQSGKTHHWRNGGPDGQPLLLWAGGYSKQGHALTLIVAEDLSALQDRLYLYSGGFVGLAIFALVVLLLIQQRIVRRSFQPLRRLSTEIDQLERGEIEQLTDEVPLELRPLVVEVNRLLELVSQRLQRSRTALGNLAHALKGPLNLLNQLAASERLRDQGELGDELQQHTDRLSQLIEHELKRARLAGAGSASQRFVSSEELPTLVELLKRIYSEKQLSIEAHYPQGTLSHVDRNDLLELLGNLLDNACKWASRRVICHIEKKDGITVTVEDDGPGVSTEKMEGLTQRGSRIDESLPGHGLGLAIVSEIAEIYNGNISVSHSSELGGLKVRIELHPLRSQ